MYPTQKPQAFAVGTNDGIFPVKSGAKKGNGAQGRAVAISLVQSLRRRWETQMRCWIIGISTAVFPTFFVPAHADPADPEPQACPYTIEDGDTFVIAATAEKIRLMGFDTPEIGSHAWCEAEQRLGQKASERLSQLVCGPGAAVTIERNAARPTDRYGRTLAVVRLAGVDLAEIMVSEGWARPYHGGGRRKGWCSRDSRDDLNQPSE